MQATAFGLPAQFDAMVDSRRAPGSGISGNRMEAGRSRTWAYPLSNPFGPGDDRVLSADLSGRVEEGDRHYRRRQSGENQRLQGDFRAARKRVFTTANGGRGSLTVP